MSRSAFPYLPPDPYGHGTGAPTAGGRGAAILMLVLGLLMLASGACCVGVGKLMPWDKLPPEQKAQLDELAKQSKTTPQMIGDIMAAGGVVCAIPGVALLILAVFVARGSFAGTIVSLVLTCIILLLIGLLLPGVIVNAAAAPGASAAAGLAVVLVPLGLFVWLIVLLSRAIKAAGRHQAALLLHQQQYWQSLQQQRRYDQNAPPPPPQ